MAELLFLLPGWGWVTLFVLTYIYNRKDRPAPRLKRWRIALAILTVAGILLWAVWRNIMRPPWA